MKPMSILAALAVATLFVTRAFAAEPIVLG